MTNDNTDTLTTERPADVLGVEDIAKATFQLTTFCRSMGMQPEVAMAALNAAAAQYSSAITAKAMIASIYQTLNRR